jgi:hypothetical protein
MPKWSRSEDQDWGSHDFFNDKLNVFGRVGAENETVCGAPCMGSRAINRRENTKLVAIKSFALQPQR